MFLTKIVFHLHNTPAVEHKVITAELEVIKDARDPVCAADQDHSTRFLSKMRPQNVVVVHMNDKSDIVHIVRWCSSLQARLHVEHA